jgi:hypothetical protein
MPFQHWRNPPERVSWAGFHPKMVPPPQTTESRPRSPRLRSPTWENRCIHGCSTATTNSRIAVVPFRCDATSTKVQHAPASQFGARQIRKHKCTSQTPTRSAQCEVGGGYSYTYTRPPPIGGTAWADCEHVCAPHLATPRFSGPRSCSRICCNSILMQQYTLQPNIQLQQRMARQH